MKKKMLGVIAILCFGFVLIGFIAGVFYGIDMTERITSVDTSRLSKVLNAIDEYYQINNGYPTEPNFYNNSSNCELPLEYVNIEMVSLYCGVGGSHSYHIEFTDNGNVEVSRE